LERDGQTDRLAEMRLEGRQIERKSHRHAARKKMDSLKDITFYLPSHDGRLAKSNSLVFDDAPHYKSRIQGNVGVQIKLVMQ
jgi:hypothetical protein